MNFEFMPELGWWWSYPIILLVMLMVALAMLAFLWRRGWLSGWLSGRRDAPLELIKGADGRGNNTYLGTAPQVESSPNHAAESADGSTLGESNERE